MNLALTSAWKLMLSLLWPNLGHIFYAGTRQEKAG
jgi:hypothetical protein